ncbi:MAG: hypothetical protein M0R46_13160 [Candidatus Muirbacterium halophilum]|nr:hypothetical protein [Candidatus Muirbacterium halophilum]
MVNKVQDIIKIWSPVIECIGIKNDTIKKILSIYAFCCYLVDVSSTIGHLPEKMSVKTKDKIKKELLIIKDKIFNLRKFRLKIVNEYYNYMTCDFEYELEDGTFISKEKINKDISFTKEELIIIFGESYFNIMEKMLIEANLIYEE